MKLALAEARRAARLGEVPVGAVVVSAAGPHGPIGNGPDSEEPIVVGRGHNLMIARHDPTAHAEVVALRRAARRCRNYRLTGATLYVTLEPCLLCLGAIVQARVGRVVYGAADPKRGALGVARGRRVAALLHHKYRVTAGVLEEEGAEILRGFFRQRRLARVTSRW